MSAPDSVPAPLRIPAILQNPVNKSQKQVEAHNAQQREKVDARRERDRTAKTDTGFKGDRRGKRVIRRVDNVKPSRSDYYPSYPLNPRPPLPLKSLPRKASIPGAELPPKDPFSSSSQNGIFSTSIKGIRQALRKKGRRTEVVVMRVEGELRGWLGGKGVLEEGRDAKWTVVDETLVEDVSTPASREEDVNNEDGTNDHSATTSRRMPERHRLKGSLPPLPISEGMLPAIMELSRSAGHLTWMAVEGFERLVIHLICRYYEVVSWSEDHVTTSGQKVRLTHIIRPTITKPRPAPTGIMYTPENSDLSAPPSSDSSSYSTETDTASEDSDTATEMGEKIPDSEQEPEHELEGEDEIEGYRITPGPDGFENLSIRSPTLETAMSELEVSALDLQRTYSNSSSQYAESEGGSDFGTDSLTLPPPPIAAGERGFISSFANGPVALGAPPAMGAGLHHSPRRINAVGVAGLGMGWEDKPTFFEYLYGA